MRSAKPVNESGLSLPPDSYVYAVRPLADNLITSCSDNSLRIVDKSLKLVTQIPNANKGLNALATSPIAPHAVWTCGNDGSFQCWDTRSLQVVGLHGHNPSTAGIASIAISGVSGHVAIGSQLANHQAAVTTWDPRSLQTPVTCYVESHNDDITELRWHPTEAVFLLSGSTDGLLNLYDTRVADEDEAIVRTWNHGSVSHAAWPEDAGIEDGHELIYAVSHDEQLGVYRIPLASVSGEDTRYKVVNDEDVENEALTVGDVRPKFDCEYVIDFLPSGGHMIAGVGKHSEKRIDLLDLNEVLSPDAPTSANTIRIDCAHGEEIVRSFHIDGASGTIYTSGEDGMLRSWRVDEDDSRSVGRGASQTSKDKKGIARGKRYAPY